MVGYNRSRSVFFYALLVEEHFGTVFEMHVVVVVPASAPDEAVLLKNIGDFAGKTVAVADAVGLGGFGIVPFPVVGLFDTHIDCDAVGVGAEAVGACYHSPVDGGGAAEEGFPLGMAVEGCGNLLQLTVDVVDLADVEPLSDKGGTPGDGGEVVGHLLLGLTVHLLEEGFAADAACIVEGGDLVGIDPVRHVFDVGIVHHLDDGFLLAVVVDHGGAVAPINKVVGIADDVFGIGFHETLDKEGDGLCTCNSVCVVWRCDAVGRLGLGRVACHKQTQGKHRKYVKFIHIA